MQRGRFAQEFLAELMREPRALKVALLGERARWLRALKINGREDLLFELELLLRALELSFDRRHQAPDGRALLGQDFADELRAVKDGLHRAGMVARRLTLPHVEQGFQFRAYVQRQAAEEARRKSVQQDLVEQKTPEESLYVLRHQLRALQGLADQLLRQPFVTYQAFSDLAGVGEYTILTSKYFRPPGSLEFRTEYDRVGSVRLLELVKRVSESRARKALALGFLACFRLLRYLRFIPASPTAAPRRALLIAWLVRDESLSVASYLTTDLPRLATAATEAQLISAAAGDAAEHLRNAVTQATMTLQQKPVERASLEQVRDALSEGAKAAASALAQAVEPGASAAEIFDGQRARRERAERLRRDLWILGQLLRNGLDGLFPAMKGEATRAFETVAALSRFVAEFRQMGYYLLRAGDHEPFDRFFGSLEALTNAAPSPARDRHLYLECRRFLTVVERALALVSRRAELVGVPPDVEQFNRELQRYHAAGASLAPALDTALADQLLAPPTDDDPADDELARTPSPHAPPPLPFDPAAQDALSEYFAEGEVTEPVALDPQLAEEAELQLSEDPDAPPPRLPPAGDEQTPPASYNPELTRRIWRGE